MYRTRFTLRLAAPVAFAFVTLGASPADNQDADEFRVKREPPRSAPARPQGRGPGGESDEIREARRRLGVMRWGVDALVEAGLHDAAHQLELAMHARQLAIEGVRDEQSARMRASAPDRGRLSEILRRAAILHANKDHPDRAGALVELADVYADQWARQQRAEREGRVTEPRREFNLDSLAERLKILVLARDAYVEAGRERNAATMVRVLHLGELQRAGASDEAIARAAEGLSQATLIELVGGARDLYREWGHEERAGACHALFAYYTYREQASRQDGERSGTTDLERELRELAQRVEHLRAELAEIRGLLRELRRASRERNPRRER